MTKFEYFIRNAFVVAFMAFLWMMTAPLYLLGDIWTPLTVSFALIATLFLGEILWDQVVYKALYPIRRL